MNKRRRPFPRSVLPRPVSRREFLGYSAFAAGTTALAACGPAVPDKPDPPPPDPVRPTTNPADFDHGTPLDFVPEDVPLLETVFSLPVQSGQMRVSSVNVWGYASDMQAKLLRVWRDSTEAGKVVLVHESSVEPEEPGTLKSPVGGLAPDTQYRFAFFSVDGDGNPVARSAIGRFRTAWPDPYLWPIVVGATTCTNQRYAPWHSLERMAQENVDVFLHVGDMSYNDGAYTIEEYRAKWHATINDIGYRALLPTTGMYIAWDDHEIANDLNPERVDPIQIVNAKRAFFQMVAQEPNEHGSLWTSYRWGLTAEFVVLDCRTERKPSTLDTDQQIYMSEAQLEWFKQTLLSSPCHFKVILNSVPMTDMPESFWANDNDRWEGYEYHRNAVLDFIVNNNIRNVWFVSGDFHVGFVARLESQGPRSGYFDFAVGPGGNLGNPLGALADSDPELREQIFPAGQFLYGKGRMAATILTFDPLRDQVHVRYVDAETNETLFDQWLKQE